MRLIHHSAVANDIARAVKWYRSIDLKLGDQLLQELRTAFNEIEAFPKRSHFDNSGWRRCNLRLFPYHILFVQELDVIRVMVVRHNHQRPEFGTGRK